MVETLLMALIIALNYFCDLGVARIVLPICCWYIGAYGLWEDKEDE